MTEDLTLDLRGVRSLEDFHDIAAEVFKFPHYYGRNLDAFWDCINDFIDRTNVRVLNFDSLASDEQVKIGAYIKILLKYQTQTKGQFLVEFMPSHPSIS